MSGFSSGNKPTGLVDLDTAQTVENKTIQTSSIESPTRSDVKQDTYANLSDYAAGTGAYAGDGAASNGQLCFASDQKKMYQVIDSGLAEVGGSAGGGGYNYNDNSFDDDVSSVTSSANIIATQETVSPLLGAGSLKITKDAANRSAEFVILKSFSIDEAHKATVFEVEAGIKINSGVVADEDWEIYAYDNTNSKEIELVPKYVYFSEGFTAQHKATFQTSSDGVSYDLRMRPNANVESQELLLDGFGSSMLYVGPQIGGSSGPVISDWESYTPANQSITNGSFNFVNAQYRRVGGNIECSMKWDCTGSGVSYYQLNSTQALPAGLTIDAVSIINIMSFGNWYAADSSGASGNNSFGGEVVVNSAGSIQLQTAATDLVDNGSPFPWENGDALYLSFTAPILGWSSNQVMSSESSSREISFKAYRNAAWSHTAGSGIAETVPFDATAWDKSNSFDESTGEYILPESGTYVFGSSVRFSSLLDTDKAYMQIQHEGNLVAWLDEIAQGATSARGFGGSVIINGVKGDVVKVLVTHTDSASEAITAGEQYSHFWGYKIQSPQQIAASEKVYGFANTDGTANGDFVSGASETIKWTAVNDSHDILNSSGELIMPRAGILSITSSIMYTDTGSWTLGNRAYMYIYVDSSLIVSNLKEMQSSDASTYFFNQNISLQGLAVNKGDIVKINLKQFSGADFPLTSAGYYNTLGWELK